MNSDHCFGSHTVVCEIEAEDKYYALQQIVRRAPVFSEIKDLQAFEASVLSREKILCTGFGHGVAVAHGRSDGVPRILIGLGLSRKGIPYGSPDGKPVHLLFVIASPPSKNIDYLQALSALVRVLRDQAARETLMEAGDASEIERRIRTAFNLSLERVRGPVATGPACTSVT